MIRQRPGKALGCFFLLGITVSIMICAVSCRKSAAPAHASPQTMSESAPVSANGGSDAGIEALQPSPALTEILEAFRTQSAGSDFTALEQSAGEAEQEGLLDAMIAELENQASAADAPPSVYISLSVLYGRKGLKTKEYAALAAAETAAKKPGVVFNIALVYGRKKLLAGSPDADSFMVGSLEILTVPEGASVQIDGQDAGKAPLLLEKVKAGKRNITLMSEGYQNSALQTEIAVGAKQTISRTLTELAVKLPELPGPLAKFITQHKLNKTFETNFKDAAFKQGLVPLGEPVLTKAGAELYFNGRQDYPFLARQESLRSKQLALYSFKPDDNAAFTFELIREDGSSFESFTLGGNPGGFFVMRKQLSSESMVPLPWAISEFSYKPGSILTAVIESLEDGYIVAGFFNEAGQRSLIRWPFPIEGKPWNICIKGGAGKIRLDAYREFQGSASSSLIAVSGGVYPPRDPPVKANYATNWELVWMGPSGTTIHGITFLGGEMWWNFYQTKTSNRVDQTGKILQSIPHTGNKLTGISNDGSQLWLTSEDNRIYYLNTRFQKQKDFATAGGDSTAVYWHRGTVWNTGFIGEVVQLDLQGNVLRRIKTPVKNNEGLVVGQDVIFAADYDNSRITVMDMQGRVITAIPSPLQRPIALAWDGEFLYLTGDTQPQVYRLRL